MGRPSKLNPEIIEKMLSEYRKGATDKQVAEIINVTEKTINNWKGKNPELLQALKVEKSGPDMRVEASLFNRAIGYSHKDEKIFVFEGQVIRVETIKHYPPDVTAQIFWLKNRKPKEWSDRNITAEDESTNNTSRQNEQTLSFTEFCDKSFYFIPFPRQEEMRAFGLDVEDTRLLLGARGYGKTDFVTIMGTAYSIYLAYKNGTDLDLSTNLIITKAKPRVKAIIKEIGNALEKNGVPLDKFNSTEIRVKGLVGQDHSVEGITIKTSMRGRHPKRIVMDDPVTDEDVSEAMRTLVKRRYDEAYKLCKNICIIGQPAHFDDLYANLRNVIKTMEVPHGQIPELDEDLEAMRLAGVDKNSIEMSYHLRIPKDGASIFAEMKFIDRFPVGDSVAFIDPSEGGDYTALSIGKALFDGFAFQGHAWKKAWYHCLDDIVPILLARGVKKLCFETNCTGSQPVFQLRELLGKHGIGVVGKASDSNKHAIIQSAGSYSHLIYLSRESDKVYTDQVTKYEYNAKFDDSPDSLARLLEWVGLIRGKK